MEVDQYGTIAATPKNALQPSRLSKAKSRHYFLDIFEALYIFNRFPAGEKAAPTYGTMFGTIEEVKIVSKSNNNEVKGVKQIAKKASSNNQDFVLIHMYFAKVFSHF